MKEGRFDMLLMAILELKMDPITIRGWQHSSREHKEVPPCSDLLEVVDLQARESESSLRDVVKKRSTNSYPDKRTTNFYMVCMEDNCV